MSKRYTPEEKATALAALEEHDGDIMLASLTTGIPERTLHTWKRAQLPKKALLQRRQSKKNTPPQPPPPLQTLSFPSDPEFEEALREQGAAADHIIDDVLDELLKDVQVLAKRIRHNFDQAPPVSQIMALTRLLDRVIKLDARKPRLETKTRAYIMRFQDPDGSIHKSPPWHRSDGGTDEDYDLTPWKRKPHLQTEAED